MLRAVLWLAALPGLAALQVSQPLLHAVTGKMQTRRYPGTVLALSDENGMQVRIDSDDVATEAEVSAEDLGVGEADDPCMLLVHMQSPADTGAMFWSEVLMESGAWCVSLSDGAFGKEEIGSNPSSPSPSPSPGPSPGPRPNSNQVDLQRTATAVKEASDLKKLEYHFLAGAEDDVGLRMLGVNGRH